MGGGLVLEKSFTYLCGPMKNYYKYWADRYVKDGLRFIKTIIGIGLSVAFGIQSFPIGVMFFGWVLVETLIEKK
jgi:hypothetical protein